MTDTFYSLFSSFENFHKLIIYENSYRKSYYDNLSLDFED